MEGDPEADPATAELSQYVTSLRNNEPSLTVVDFGSVIKPANPDDDGLSLDNRDVDIRTICTALHNNTVVTEIRLVDFYYTVSDLGADSFGEMLRVNRSISSVVIKNTRFVGPEEHRFGPIFRGLFSKTELKKLTVASCDDLEGDEDMEQDDPTAVGREDIVALARLVEQTNTLEGLDLCPNLFDTDDVEIFAPSLRANTSIKSLNLIGNHLLLPSGADRLCEALGGRGSIKLEIPFDEWAEGERRTACQLIASRHNIEELVLDGHETFVDETMTRSLAEALRQNSSISLMLIRSMTFDDDALDAVASALAASNGTKVLGFHSVALADRGARALANAFKNNTSLDTLGLFRCNIGDEGARSMASLLAENSHIENLNLDRNEVGNAGASALADAIASRRDPFKRLSLCFNPITDDGALHICRLLQDQDSSLEDLALKTQEPLGSQAWKSIATALKANHSLKGLSISTLYNTEAMTALIGILKYNQTLERVYLLPDFRVPFDDDEKRRVGEALIDTLYLNHTLKVGNFQHNALNDEDSKKVELLVDMNKDGPILGSTRKNVPFPKYLMSNLCDAAIPEAIARIDKAAKLDGIFSFVKQMHEGITGRIEIKEARKRKAEK